MLACKFLPAVALDSALFLREGDLSACINVLHVMKEVHVVKDIAIGVAESRNGLWN